VKKEEEMRKKIAGFMIAGVLVLALGLVSIPAQAEWTFGPVGGYYSPNFGPINEELDEHGDLYGTDFAFEAGMMYGLALGYNGNSHFGLRLEYNSFESKKSDDFWSHSVEYSDYWDLDLSLTVTPVILSGIYRFFVFYIGAGVGWFPTEIKVTGTLESYQAGVLYYGGPVLDSRSASAIGILGLAGLEYRGGWFFGGLEARYIVAEGELEDWDLQQILDSKIDLSGFEACVTAGFRF